MNYVLITKLNDTKIRYPAGQDKEIPIKPGDKIFIVDEKGRPVDVELQQQQADLILSFDDGVAVTLKDYYLYESEIDPVTIGIKPSAEETEAYDSNGTIGGLLENRAFSLMRFLTNKGIDLGNQGDGRIEVFNSAGAASTEFESPVPQESATAPIRSREGNSRPTAADDLSSGFEDQPIFSIPVLDNDFDSDGDLFSIAGAPTALNGVVGINPNGTINYVPNPDFNGEDTISYTIADPSGATSTATVLVSVEAVNDAPVASPDVASVTENSLLAGVDLVGNDTDPDGDPLSVSGIPVAENGTVVVNADGTINYTPDLNFTGTDVITYQVNDGNGGIALSTLKVKVNRLNVAPIGKNDVIITNEDSPVNNLDVLGNDSDADGDVLSIQGTPTALNGTISVNPNGTLNYTPAPNFNGTDTITYVVGDGYGGSDVATVGVTVIPANDAPNGQSDNGIGSEDSVITGNVISNDTDIEDGSSLTVLSNTNPANGMLIIAGNGAYTYTPNANFNGTDTFSYVVQDPSGATDTATVTLTVNAVNDGPAATNDTGTVNADATLTLNQANGIIDTNDTDLDGDTLNVSAIRTGAESGSGLSGTVGNALVGSYGTLTLSASGSYNYIADQTATKALSGGVTVTDTFTYTISDGNGGSDTAEIVITVTGVNDAPIAENDTAAVNEEATLSVNQASGVIDTNDTDLDGDTLSVTAIRTGEETGSGAAGTINNALVGTYGTLTLSADGSYEYVADQSASNMLAAGVTATDTFTYTIGDGNGASDSAQIVFTVTGVNDGPAAVNDTGEVNEDATLAVNQASGVIAANDTDLDGDTLNVSAIRTGLELGSGVAGVVGNGLAGTYGTLTLTAGGSYSYVADRDAADALAVGVTATDTFTYTISDGNGGTDTAEIVITVTGVNDGPVAVNDTGAVNEEATLIVNQASGVIDTNDTDLDGGILNVTAIRTGEESGGGTAGAVNSGLAGSYGTLTLNANGSYEYVADQSAANALAVGITATDTFTYTISDGNGGTDTAELVITVTGVNDGPVAVNDTGAVNEDATLIVNQASGVIDTNDTDLDGDTLSVITIRTGEESGGGTAGAVNSGLAGSYGTLTLNANGSYEYVADQPAADALSAGVTVTDTFTYTISDGNGGTDAAEIVITVTGVNDGPVAVNDTGAVNEEATLIVNQASGVIDTNDTDLDGGILNVTAIRTGEESGGGTAGAVNSGLAGSYGTLTLNANGSYEYVADQSAANALAVGITATDTFTYTISDGNGGTDTAELVITVTGVNDGPVAVNDTGAVNEDASLSVNQASGVIDTNDTDLDGDTLSVTAIRTGEESGGGISGAVSNGLTGAYGTLTLNADGNYSYVADQGAANALAVGVTATDTFTYTISDGNGGTDTSELVITVTGVNDGPVAVNDTGAVNEEATLIVNQASGVIDTNDTDLDGDTLQVTAIRTGAESGSGTSGTVSNALVGTYGTLTLNADGSYSYVADLAASDGLALGVTATETYTYTVSDGKGGTDTAELVLTVAGENDGPSAVSDAGIVNEDETLTVNQIDGVIDTNDTDLDGDALAVTAIRTGPESGGGTSGSVNSSLAGSFGTLALSSNGSYTYVADQSASDALAAGVTVTDTFTYAISDGSGGTDTAEIVITVTGVNDGPAAINDSGAVNEDDILTVNSADGVIEANDTDVDGGILSVSAIRTGPESGSGTVGTVGSGLIGTYGTLTMNSDGSYDYRADQVSADALVAGVTATDTFTYLVNDGNGGTDSAEITITVTGVNDNPVAVDDGGAVYEDATLAVTQANGVIDTNDTDLDGGTLNVSAIRTGAELGSGVAGVVGNGLAGTYGTLTLTAGGSYSYVADRDAADALAVGVTAIDTFTYTISDGNGGADTAEIVITVTGVNDTPVANDDTVTASLNTPATYSVTDLVVPNDTDIDGDTLTISEVTSLNNGTVVLNDEGTVTFTPTNGFFGSASFEYTVSDGNGGTDTATVTVNVVNDNLAPVAVDDAGAVNEDATLAVNQVAGAIDSNDTDPDGDTLTVTAIRTGNEFGVGNSGTVGGVLAGTYGTLSLNADGSYTYAADQSAADALAVGETATDTFTYTINDGKGVVDRAEIVFTVTGVNDGPVAVNDTGAVNEDATLIVNQASGVIDTNDTDLDGDTLSVTAIRTGEETGGGTAGSVSNGLTGAYGTLTLNPNGNYSYVADQPAADALSAGVTVTDIFTYTISDGNGGTDAAEIVITVTGVNDGPVAVNDTGAVNEDATLIVNQASGVIDTNDTGLDGDTLSVTAVRTGEESGSGNSGAVDTALSGAYGTLTLRADGSYEYVADQSASNMLSVGVTATDTFTYTIGDGNGASDSAQIVFTVTGVNDGPAAVNDTGAVNEDATLAVNQASGVIAANDTDLDGDTLNVSAIRTGLELGSGVAGVVGNGLAGTYGTLTLTAGGSYSYVADRDAADALAVGVTAIDTFTYTISDGNGGMDAAEIVFTVTGVNDGPVAVNDTGAVNGEATLIVNQASGVIDTNDTELDGDTLSVTAIRTGEESGGGTAGAVNSGLAGSYGTLTLNANGSYEYVADQGAANALAMGITATDTFTYTISDGNGGTDAAELKITVTGVNDGPVAVNDTGAVNEDATLIVNQASGVIDTNDTDLDGDTLSVTAIRTGEETGGGTAGSVSNGLTGAYGTLTLNPNGNYSYVADQPAADALSAGVTVTDIFTYTISDGNGGTDAAEIVITVTGGNDGPVAVNDTGAVNEDATLIVNQASGVIDTNDTDLDGDTLQVTAIRTGAESGSGTSGTVSNALVGTYGTLTLNADGSYSYVADLAASDGLALGVTATETYTYTVSDGKGGTDTAELVLTVTGENDGPSAVSDAGIVNEDETLTVNQASGVIDFNDTDIDGGTLNVTAIRTGAELGSGTSGSVNSGLAGLYGTLTLNVNGSYLYVADQAAADSLASGITATDTFTYTISDGSGGTDTAEIAIVVTGVNDGPAAVNDTGAVTEDATLIVNQANGVIDINDSDSDGDALNVTAIRTGLESGTGTLGVVNSGLAGTYGTLTLNDDGSYSYVADQGVADSLAQGVTATDTFTYTISDGNGGTDTAELMITVTGVNDGPVAVNDTGAVNEEAILIVNQASGVIDTNDTDLDGDALSVTAIRTGEESGSGISGSVSNGLTGAYGTLTLNPNGNYSYVADQPAAEALSAGFTVTDTFTYTVSDGNGGTDAGEIVITVTGANDGPAAVNDTGAVNEDATLAVNQASGVIAANDTDLDGDTLSVTAIRTGEETGSGAAGTINNALVGTYGTLTLSADGSYEYVADQSASNMLAAGVTATDTFTYTIGDGNGASDSAQIVFTVTGVNDGPAAVNDTGAVNEDATLVVNQASGVIDTNDTDLDGDTLNVTAIRTGLELGSGVAGVVGNGLAGTYGTLTLTAGGSYSYVADRDAADALAVGVNAIDTFTYTTSDGNGGTDTAEIVITVTGVNDSPAAFDDTGSVNEDATLTVNQVFGVIDNNDTDVDGDALNVTAIRTGPETGGGTAGVVSSALSGTYGTLTLNADGSYEYFANQVAAEALAVGETATDIFTYAISDGKGGSDTAELVITITGENDGPLAVDDTGAVNEDATLTVNQAFGVIDSNDTDVDGDTLNVTAIRTGAESGNGTSGAVNSALSGIYGTLTLASDGSYDYVADQPASDALAQGVTAMDTFTYAISDGNGGTDMAELVITVTGVNDGPLAVDDTGSVNEGETHIVNSVSGVIDTNDSDPDGDMLNVVAIRTGTESGSGTTGSVGSDLVGIYGTLTLSADGSYSYVADQAAANALAMGVTASDTFAYAISDGKGGADTAEIVITVTGTNDGPTAAGDSVATYQDSAATYTLADLVTPNDTDPDGDTLFIASVDNANNGTVVLNPGGTVTFTPSSGFVGGASFEYTISDGNGGTDTATVAVTVNNTNDDPVAVEDTGSVDENATLLVNETSGVIEANDTDLDGDTLIVSAIRTGSESGSGTSGAVGNGLTGIYGTLTLASEGSYSYVSDQAAADGLALGVTATDTFTYTISDGNGGSDTAEIIITVTGVNDGPVAVDDTGAVNEDAALTVNQASGVINSNDTDLDGDTLIVTAIRTGAESGSGTSGTVNNALIGNYGTLTLNTDGRYGYVADQAASDGLALGVTATDTFTYTINDGNGGSDSAELVLTVTGENDGPVAVNDTGAVDNGATLTVNEVNGVVDHNDTDLDGDILTITAIRTGEESGSGTSGTVNNPLAGAYGTLTLNADGSYSYVADQASVDSFANGATGTDTFTYMVSDGNGGTDTAEITITVTSAGGMASDPPTLDLETAIEIQDIITNGEFSEGTGPDWDSWTETGPVSGSARPLFWDDDSDHSITQTGLSGWAGGPGVNGAGRITISLSYDTSETDNNYIEISVGGVTYATIAYYRTQDLSDYAGITFSNGATGPDLEVEAGNGSVEFTIDLPALAANSGDLQILSTQDWQGDSDAADNFTLHGVRALVNVYSDGNDFSADFLPGGGAVAIAGITEIVDSDDTQMESARIILTNAQTGDVFNVSGSSAASGTLPSGISWTSTNTGTEIIYNLGGTATLADYQAAIEAFTFENTLDSPDLATRIIEVTVNDGGVDSEVATSMIFLGANDVPVAVNDTGMVNEDATIIVPRVLGVIDSNDTDLNGDNLSVTAIRTGTESGSGTLGTVSNGLAGMYGTLTLDSDGGYRYAADQSVTDALAVGVTAIDTFTYTVSDGNGGIDTAEIAIRVTGVNDAPVAIDDSFSILPDQVFNSGNLFSNNGSGADSDPDGDFLLLNPTLVSGPSNGSVTLGFNGTFSYTPDSGFGGTDSFVYEIGDGQGGTASATATMIVDCDGDGVSDDAEDVYSSWVVVDSADFGVPVSSNGVNGTLDVSSKWGLPLGSVVLTISDAGTTTDGQWKADDGTPFGLSFSGIVPVEVTVIHVPSLDGLGEKDGLVSTDGQTWTNTTASYGSSYLPGLSGNNYYVENIDGLDNSNTSDFTWLSDGPVSSLDVVTSDNAANAGWILEVRPLTHDLDGDGVLNSCDADTTPPIIIDIDRDGIEVRSVEEGIALDVDGDGQKEQTAWADEDDAVLIFDGNNNGDVDGREEYAFADYSDDRDATDMEGLRAAFDTNLDGLLSSEDEAFDQFKIWQDADGDGEVGDGEMLTLSEAGIESIGLISDGHAYELADGDVHVHGESVVSYTDGSTGVAADAEFDFRELLDGSNDEPLEVVSESGEVTNLDDADSAGALGTAVADSGEIVVPESSPTVLIDEQAANDAAHS